MTICWGDCSRFLRRFHHDIDPTGLGNPAQAIVGGGAIQLAEGPLAFDFGDYSIWATTVQYTNPAFPRPVRARNAGGSWDPWQNPEAASTDDQRAVSVL